MRTFYPYATLNMTKVGFFSFEVESPHNIHHGPRNGDFLNCDDEEDCVGGSGSGDGAPPPTGVTGDSIGTGGESFEGVHKSSYGSEEVWPNPGGSDSK